MEINYFKWCSNYIEIRLLWKLTSGGCGTPPCVFSLTVACGGLCAGFGHPGPEKVGH